MLSIGKRVKKTQSPDDFTDILGMIGTVKKSSQFGYVTVLWDNGVEDRFSPMSVSTNVEEVTGDDALPRHDWDVDIDVENPPCVKCRVIQTNENEFGPCRGANNER